MVRAGVVRHPSEWRWCGYDELIGKRKRYRLIDLDCVLKWFDGMSREKLKGQYRNAIELTIEREEMGRNPVWTESIAVGSEEFVKHISDQIQTRIRLKVDEVADGIWVVREPLVPYNGFLHSENGF
jgi:hypothetical protein